MIPRMWPSDVFEHQQLLRAAGVGATQHKAILGRALRGVPSDLAWRRQERRVMEQTTPARRTTGPTRHLRWLAFVPLVPAAPFLFFGLAWGTPLQVSVGIALVFVAGLMHAIAWTIIATLILSNTPQTMRGRMMGLRTGVVISLLTPASRVTPEQALAILDEERRRMEQAPDAALSAGQVAAPGQ